MYACVFPPAVLVLQLLRLLLHIYASCDMKKQNLSTTPRIYAAGRNSAESSSERETECPRMPALPGVDCCASKKSGLAVWVYRTRPLVAETTEQKKVLGGPDTTKEIRSSLSFGVAFGQPRRRRRKKHANP